MTSLLHGTACFNGVSASFLLFPTLRTALFYPLSLSLGPSPVKRRGFIWDGVLLLFNTFSQKGLRTVFNHGSPLPGVSGGVFLRFFLSEIKTREQGRRRSKSDEMTHSTVHVHGWEVASMACTREGGWEVHLPRVPERVYRVLCRLPGYPGGYSRGARIIQQF